MKWFDRLTVKCPYTAFFLKYTFLFTMLFMSLALAALHKIIAVESNPFFYANF
jgi:hypothetical protein